LSFAAGIIGMFAANYLQRSGLKVTVLDAVAVREGQSTVCGGAQRRCAYCSNVAAV